MFTCRACGHDDGVHHQFVGCCGVRECPCEGMDGKNLCWKGDHGPECGWATIRPKPEEVSEEIVRAVHRAHDAGIGVVKIHREHGIGRDIVRKIIAGTIRPDLKPVG
jgi:predicted small metal-binding protein